MECGNVPFKKEANKLQLDFSASYDSKLYAFEQQFEMAAHCAVQNHLMFNSSFDSKIRAYHSDKLLT